MFRYEVKGRDLIARVADHEGSPRPSESRLSAYRGGATDFTTDTLQVLLEALPTEARAYFFLVLYAQVARLPVESLIGLLKGVPKDVGVESDGASLE